MQTATPKHFNGEWIPKTQSTIIVFVAYKKKNKAKTTRKAIRIIHTKENNKDRKINNKITKIKVINKILKVIYITRK